MKLPALKLFPIMIGLVAILCVGGTAHALQEGDNNGGPSGSAPTNTTQTTSVDRCTKTSLLPDIYSGLRNRQTCEVELNSLKNLGLLLANVVLALLSLSGVVAVAIVIAGGFMYVASNGDSGGIKKAKDTIVNSLIGLGIVLLAFGIVNFISGQFK